MPLKNKPLTNAELEAYEAKRDLAAELLPLTALALLQLPRSAITLCPSVTHLAGRHRSLDTLLGRLSLGLHVTCRGVLVVVGLCALAGCALGWLLCLALGGIGCLLFLLLALLCFRCGR